MRRPTSRFDAIIGLGLCLGFCKQRQRLVRARNRWKYLKGNVSPTMVKRWYAARGLPLCEGTKTKGKSF